MFYRAVLDQGNAPGYTAAKMNRTLALQRLEVGFSGIGGSKAEMHADFRPGGWITLPDLGLANEIQYFLLAFGQARRHVVVRESE